MVYISSHGGSCCGARHIHGFGTGDHLTNIEQMHNHAASAPDRLTEIILNRTQCINSPRLLAAMAERGYVLTTGFKNGNHNSDVFVFHRSDRRLRLDNTERDFGFVWAGQIASPTLHGNLDALRPVERVGGDNNRVPEHLRRYGSPFHTGYWGAYPADLVLRYVGTSAALRGDLFGLPTGYRNWSNTALYLPSGSRGIRVRNLRTGNLHDLSINSFHVHRFTQAADVPPAAPAPLGNQLYTLAPEGGAAPAVVEAERIVYTTFHNVYRDGRIGAGYPTSEEARNAAPRALNRLTRHIYNTGRVEDIFNGVQN